MYNITPPQCNNREDYHRISGHRNPVVKDRLFGLSAQVMSAYAKFQANALICAPTAPLPLQSEDAQILRNNYNTLDKGKPCADIREDILASADLGQCPYCRLNDATTLDHILPKDRYPEFSVLRSNLAPCCRDCNSAKELALRGNSVNDHLNIYFDKFPTTQYLHVQIVNGPNFVAFKYSLSFPSGLSKNFQRRIATHFAVHDLGRRYGRRASVEMSHIAGSLKALLSAGGPTAVQTFLDQQAKSVRTRWPSPEWLAVLWESASLDASFCSVGVMSLP